MDQAEAAGRSKVATYAAKVAAERFSIGARLPESIGTRRDSLTRRTASGTRDLFACRVSLCSVLFAMRRKPKWDAEGYPFYKLRNRFSMLCIT